MNHAAEHETPPWHTGDADYWSSMLAEEDCECVWRVNCEVWIAKHHPFISWLLGVTARWLLVAACAGDCYLLPQSSYPHFLVETRLPPTTSDSASYTSWTFWQPLGHFVLGFTFLQYIHTIKTFLSCCCYAKSTVLTLAAAVAWLRSANSINRNNTAQAPGAAAELRVSQPITIIPNELPRGLVIITAPHSSAHDVYSGYSG